MSMKKDYFKMIFVLTAIATVCGFLLAAVKDFTAVRIEEQILVNVKGPAVKRVLDTSTNDVIGDRREITIDDQKHVVFVGKKEGKPWAVAFESSGAGFGGDIGVMVGFDLKKEVLTGIGILTHQETPGLGARVVEPAFTNRFVNKPIFTIFKVKKDKGEIDAVSGATNSSRGVCAAVQKTITLFPAVKKKVLEN